MRRFMIVLGCGLAPACGDESEDPTSTTVAVATQVDPTTSAATTDATGDSSSGDEPTTSMTTDPATSSDPSSVTIDPDTTAGAPTECDPKMAPFLGTPPMLPQAAIEIDLGASTCAAASAAGTAPQIVLDVQMTGLIDATLFGLEIVDVSSGQPFDDPPIGDAEVIDLSPDLMITFDLVSVDGGQPVTISFEVFSKGPTLLDVAASFG